MPYGINMSRIDEDENTLSNSDFADSDLDDEEDDSFENDCFFCVGTGEGESPDSRCSYCRGKGYIKRKY